MKFIKIILISVIMILGVISISFFTFESNLNGNIEKNEKQEFIEWDNGNLFKILVKPTDLVLVNGKTIPLKATFGLKDELTQTYIDIGFIENDRKPLVIIPTFTASAYSKNGFYDFFNGNCDMTCLTTQIVSGNKLDYNSSANGVKILQLLGYDTISDLDLHKNPNILNEYNKIILLHNEYVSQIMFDVITAHHNVIFLYPNALYGKINVDLNNNQITLIRGHGFPNLDIQNGFDWENENTHPYEYDNKCESWEFYTISNGFMLNCYPEQIIWQDELFLKTLKDL